MRLIQKACVVCDVCGKRDEVEAHLVVGPEEFKFASHELPRYRPVSKVHLRMGRGWDELTSLAQFEWCSVELVCSANCFGLAMEAVAVVDKGPEFKPTREGFALALDLVKRSRSRAVDEKFADAVAESLERAHRA